MGQHPYTAAANHAERTRTVTKQERIFELKLAGATFRQIGEQLNMSHVTARKHYLRALAERTAHIDEMKDKHVTVELERLDKLILAHWPNRDKPSNAGIILRCMSTKAQLLGLNAPTKVQHEGTVVVEDADARRTRILEETADRVAGMTPEQLAAEAADLLGG